MFFEGLEVFFFDKIEEDGDEKMEIDELFLKVMVINEDFVMRVEFFNVCMCMYVDFLEEDESEDESDDDKREKRDKWKGRIGKK